MTTTITHPTISSQTALNAVTTAVQTAHDMGLKINACIVGSAGHRVAELCCDDTKVIALKMAYDKAYTANALRGATDELYEKFKDKPQILYGFNNASQNLVLLAGGLPIVFDGHHVGAIGISGASADEDKEIAIKVLKTIGADL